MTTATDPEQELADEIARCTWDPLRYVRLVYPWREPGTELEHYLGPRTWQRRICERITEHLSNPETRHRICRIAVSSGHGIGKSALVSWLVGWGIDTCVGSRVLVTANSEPQLRTKTWPEVLTWQRRSITAHWWDPRATSLASADPAHAKTWRADALPWVEHRPEAFAGLHNAGKRVLVIFDEASGIPDSIWTVVEGAMTDANTELIFICFGNPTKNTGRFRECFGRQKDLWHHVQIDSRTVEGVSTEQPEAWIAAYGEDHDIIRVRVKGQFPRASSLQFISSEVAEAATKREATCHLTDALVLGVDVARFGDDESVIQPRRGRDARTYPARRFSKLDTGQLAARVLEYRDDLGRQGFPVDAIFVDEGGIGGGVIDRLRQLGQRCVGVNNGGSSDSTVDGELVADKGAECWCKMRAWLKHGAIADDDDLKQQLEGREYGFNNDNEIVLERKEHMKKRGLSSPDRADALALTFAYPVVSAAAGGAGVVSQQPIVDFDPYA